MCGRSGALGEKETRGSVAGSRVLACRGSDTVLMTVLQACHRVLTPSPTANREYAWQLLAWWVVRWWGTEEGPQHTISVAQGDCLRAERHQERTVAAQVLAQRPSCRPILKTGREAPSRPLRCPGLTFLGVLPRSRPTTLPAASLLPLAKLFSSI